jgi:hypothetical protein
MLLEVRRNERIDPTACRFYNQFERLDYRFLLKNTDKQPDIQPKLTIELLNDTTGFVEKIRLVLPSSQ